MARIMIVDDSKISRRLLKDNLEKQGHEVVAEAANGAEALELYDEHHPDLLTMDMTMPVMDGMECLSRLKEKDPGVKVLIISAVGNISAIEEAYAAGCIGYILKPFDWEELFSVIERHTS